MVLRFLTLIVLCIGFGPCALAFDTLSEPGLAGQWVMSNAECRFTSGKVRPPRYEVSLELTLTDREFNGVGSVAGFACPIRGNYQIQNGLITYSVTDTGRCPLQRYLRDGFTGLAEGEQMTVMIGGEASATLCGTSLGKSLIYAYLERIRKPNPGLIPYATVQ